MISFIYVHEKYKYYNEYDKYFAKDFYIFLEYTIPKPLYMKGNRLVFKICNYQSDAPYIITTV
jgi:hypothetical protein